MVEGPLGHLAEGDAMKIYLSCPMSEATVADFCRAARMLKMLRDAGHEVFSPWETDEQGKNIGDLLKFDFQQIQEADAMVLLYTPQLTTWGCAMEAGKAFDCGTPIVSSVDGKRAGLNTVPMTLREVSHMLLYDRGLVGCLKGEMKQRLNTPDRLECAP